MKQKCLPIILVVYLASFASGQGGGGQTLFGDLKVDESAASGLKPMSFQVLLYSEAGNLLFRETVPSNGRYRFLNLRAGRYQIVVELENVEVARVFVYLASTFRTDYRKDLELQWLERYRATKAEVVSAADNYNRSSGQATLFTKATEASDKRHFEQAIVLLQQVVDGDAKDFPAWTQLGTAYFILKNFEESEKAYTQALKTHPDYALALISLGRLRITRKNFHGAIDVLNQAVKVQPASAQANYFLGEAYLQVKLGSKAVPYLNEAIKLDPMGMADAHLRLAALYNARDLKDRAAAEYEAYLKKRPDSPDKKRLKEYIAANKKP